MDAQQSLPEPKKEIVLTGAAPVERSGYMDAPPRYAPAYADESGSGGLLEYWQILRRRKGTVVLAAFLGVLIAVLVTLPQTPVYQARASIEIQSLNQDFMNMKQVNPVSEGADYWSNDIQTHIKLLQSQALLARVVGKLKAKTPQGVFRRTDRIATWRRALNLPEPKPVDELEQAMSLAGGSLKLRAAGQTRVVEILCDSTDPRIAADFANMLANEYIDQSLEARWQMNQRTNEWLGRQLEDMRIKLEQSEGRLQQYARQAGLLFTGGDKDNNKQNISEEKLRQIQAALSAAQADRASKQSRYEMARNAAPDALADVLNDSSLREYQLKLTDLRRQEAELKATYQPGYSKVKRVQAQIAAVDAALVRERQAITQRIKNDYDEAMRREKLLASDYATQAKLVTGESEKAIQYNILKREVDTSRQLYESMLQKMKESSVASAMRASNVRIVDAAEPPKVPYKPRLSTNGALGLLVGVFFGVAFAVIRERADRTLQAPGDAQFYLNLPELGAVPATEAKVPKRLYYRRSKGEANAPGESATSPLALTAPAKQTERVELVTWQQKPSVTAEAFRAILTSILFTGENGDRPRVLVITSAGPSEGKSTVASNLAIALAEIRRRVLVIDADMRRPRQHEIFAVSNERGLSTLLQSRALDEETLSGVVQETSIPDLFVLPSGPSTSAASSLVHSPVLPHLLKRFKHEFDTVLVDTPPMLQMPDARIVGRVADAVVLVARAGHTTRDAALAVRGRLSEDGTRMLGTILNNWNPKHSTNGYYGYSNGYGYYRGNADHNSGSI